MRAKVKRFIQKSPFLLLLVSTGILFSLIGLCGRKNIYSGQEYDPLKEPASVMMFKGFKDDIYPWQMFEEESAAVMASKEDAGQQNDTAESGAVADGQGDEKATEELPDKAKETDKAAESGEPGDEGKNSQGPAQEADDGAGSPESEVKDGHGPDPAGEAKEADTGRNGTSAQENGEGSGNGKDQGNKEDQESGASQGTVSDSGGREDEEDTKPAEEDAEEGSKPPEGKDLQERELPNGRIKPLRESTHEEYLNHISADIYGDAGVKRAAEYGFSQVDESYFDDALFIGDSRTVGLRDYTDLSEHADFYCETSLTIQKILKEDFHGLGTIEKALENKDYGKIYIMSGINELGVGTTEDFMDNYTEVVDFLHEKEPEAKIFIQGIMRVTGKKNHSDPIFNNDNINARNNAIATLADNECFFYIDVNEVVCDEEGNLNSEYTYDQLHLLGKYNDLWKQFLLSHGVAMEQE